MSAQPGHGAATAQPGALQPGTVHPGTVHSGDGAGWQLLRGQVSRQAPSLSAPPPGVVMPGPVPRDVAAGQPPGSGLCSTCRGPVRSGGRHCYHCGQHAEQLPGLLPRVVVPVAYAVKGGRHATNLWLYKSARPGAAAARSELAALLLVFLRDHGSCVWQQAGMPPPARVAVVPSRRARPGVHPLQALAAPYLALPWAPLRLGRSDHPDACDPDPWRFSAEPIAGEPVLLLDDTWTSGASALSAAAALRLAGARSVAVIVLGRHLDAGGPGGGQFGPSQLPFRPWLCGVHSGGPGPAAH